MSERHHHQHHHHQNHEHQQRYDRQFVQPQFVQPRFVQPQFHYPQHYHGGHYQDPYRGMNNYWRDSRQDYYHDHHHRDRNDFIPRMLEGILGGLLDGSLGRELDKLGVDGKQKRTVEAYDDNERLERAAFAENESPERQISMDLDFSPPQASGKESRFERTG